MNERNRYGVRYDADNATEQAAWESLGRLDREEPSARLRRIFYDRLEREARPRWWQRMGSQLGFAGSSGWLTAAGFASAGVLVGLVLGGNVGSDAARLSALEASVASLNKSLVLDRIANDSATKRLRGVIDAAGVVDEDPEVARALLNVATEDRVYAVRSAAIDVLGPQLGRASMAEEIMAMLDAADSPHVQLALVDLVLRHGTAEQVRRLVVLAGTGGLHPALADHVLDATRSEST